MCQSIWKDKCTHRTKTLKFGRSLNPDLDPCFTAGAHWNAEQNTKALSQSLERAEGAGLEGTGAFDARGFQIQAL